MRGLSGGLIAGLLTLLGAAQVLAAEGAIAAQIRKALAEHFPKVTVIAVRPAPIPGLYEVASDQEVAYTDAHGEYLLMGQLLETKTKRNLTRERWEEINAVDYQTLPFERAIKSVRGDGSREFVIFADPDCPYCQKFEQDIADLTNVTIYTFLLPLADLHPDAPRKARNIWCAPDRAVAWAEWMQKQKPAADQQCDVQPFEAIAALGGKLRINSTPTIVLRSGRRISGALTREKFEPLLN